MPRISFPRWRSAGRPGVIALLYAIAFLGSGRAQTVYVASLAGNPAGQAFNTASDGLGSAARFSLPYGIAATPAGDLYLSDSYNFRICRITPRGEVTTVAGFGAPPGASTGAAVFGNPEGLAVDPATGEVYIADAFSNTILKMSTSGVVTTLAGAKGTTGSADGAGTAARFNFPRGVAVLGAFVYVTDSQNATIRRIDKSTGAVTTLAGTAGATGAVDGVGSAARFSQPWGIAIDPTGASSLVVTDSFNHTIRRISLDGAVTTVAGAPGLSGSADGPALSARFFQPGGIAADSSGALYVADTFNHTVRKIASGVVTTIAGSAGQRGLVDGSAANARFSGPYGITVDPSGRIYVADTNNAVVRVVVTPAAPVLTAAPRDLTVDRAADVELGGVAFTSSLYPQFQWFKDGAAIAGATNPTLRLASAQALDAGAYSVRLTNPFGSATSPTFTLTVRAPPVIGSLPDPLVLEGESAATLRVTAVGSGPISFQWLRGGSALPGETGSTLTTNVPGAYTVEISNPFGTTMSPAVQVRPAKRLANLATLGFVRGNTETLVAGFSIKADEGRSKQFLIRGVGPALAALGVAAPVARTGLTLYRDAVPVATNTGWSTGADAAQLPAVAARVGAFALPAGSADSAMLVTLNPGNYTAEVTGAGGSAGVALVEIYEVAADLNRLVNLSTRGSVSETAALTAGVVVSGTAPTRLLVRAIGPALAGFGIVGAVTRPQLKLFSGGTLLASNAGWETGGDARTLADVAAASGAFGLPAGSNDSALLLTLAPGNYTAEVTGLGSSGTALVEVYEVP